MKSARIFSLVVCTLTLVCAPLAVAAQPGELLPPATIDDSNSGPFRVVGEWTYSSSLVATHYVEPVAALLNISRYVAGDYSDWVPIDEQILGHLDGPSGPSPVGYRVSLPIRADGAAVDLDQDGKSDQGVQVYAMHVASNLSGDSYLFQMDQTAYRSYLTDHLTGEIRRGTLLIYAADDQQGFPRGAGADGRFFTGDDLIAVLPAGYTLATLGLDGTVTFSRSAELRMDTIEEQAVATPDFSDQGILESFNSLIDLLAVRYAYTELRGLDWETIRAQYLPGVEAADAANDLTAFYITLTELGLSIRDGHVGAGTSDAALRSSFTRKIIERFGASLGTDGVELSDGRYVITMVVANGPAAEVGWQFGTEIVSVNGVPMADRIAGLPLQIAAGNPETIRLVQASLALLFAEGETVDIEYRQPGETGTRRASLTAVGNLAYPEGSGEVPGLFESRELEGGIGYVKWTGFHDPAYLLASWEYFLGRFHGAPGIVIDMRGNGGGNGELMYTMASYFFSEHSPASYHWLDTYLYDEGAGDLVRLFAQKFPLHAPNPALRIDGAVVVLVDERTASAGEYFPQFLQRHGRAIVVGERGTDGAGGNVGVALLPGNMFFNYTIGRSYFAGTDELNLEGKGVTLDVRVPITLENEQSKLEGKDPALAAALVALGEEAGRRGAERLAGSTWRVLRIFSALDGPANPRVPDSYSLTFNEDGTLSINTDCSQVAGEYVVGAGGSLSITPRISTLAACPPGSPAEDFAAWLASAKSMQFDETELAILLDGSRGVLGIAFTSSR